MHPVARPTLRLPQPPRLVLHCGEVFPARRRPQAEHIFHDEDTRLEKLHIAQQLAKELPARIGLQALAVVRTIDLPRRAETLARRPADDHIHPIRADDFRELLRAESREVFMPRALVPEMRKIRAQCGDGFRIEINRREALEPRAFHPQREPTAAAEEIKQSRRTHLSTPAHSSSMPTPSARQSLSTALMLGLRTPRSIPLR